MIKMSDLTKADYISKKYPVEFSGWEITLRKKIEDFDSLKFNNEKKLNKEFESILKFAKKLIKDKPKDVISWEFIGHVFSCMEYNKAKLRARKKKIKGVKYVEDTELFDFDAFNDVEKKYAKEYPNLTNDKELNEWTERFLNDVKESNEDDAYANWLKIFREEIANANFDESFTYFKKSVEIDPKRFHSWHTMGNDFYEMGKYEEAKYYFLKALEINPRHSFAKAMLEDCNEKTKKRLFDGSFVKGLFGRKN
jgi:tetratricopeptide (TPR) repeat protein